MNLQTRFSALSELLYSYRSLWQHSHFMQLNQDWQRAYPTLYSALLGLTDQQVDCFYQAHDGAASFLIKFLPGLANLRGLTQLPHKQQEVELSARLSTNISGRKWRQIKAFIGAAGQLEHTNRIVDWCAGKSHLGRCSAVFQQKSLWAIERDAQLCAAGRSLTDKWLQAVEFTPIDVLDQAIAFLPADQVLALHACGDLHRKLVVDWLVSESGQLVLAPCCYHKWLGAHYQPVSLIGRQSDLHLSREQVQLAVQEWVTSSPREQQQTKTMMQYRLAFDVLQRELRDDDTYLNSPPLPYGVLKQGGEAVLKLLCAHKDLHPYADPDWNDYLQKGKARYEVYRRLQLVNQCFRRALELWLVLDLALSLEENGAVVDVFTFCERELSPRNILIQATRPVPANVL